MSSIIFTEAEFNQILEKIYEQGSEAMTQRDKLILHSYSDDDSFLINYCYNLVREYVEIQYMNPVTNEEMDDDDFFKELMEFYEKLKDFQTRYRENEKYLRSVLHSEEILEIFRHISEQYFNEKEII
mgnify:CR=1 FL=1|jgi:hypothetical protein